MKKILFPLISVILLTMSSCSTEVPPVLTATIADSITVDAVYCHTTVTEGSVEDCGFYYGTSKSSVNNGKSEKVQATHSASVISGVITGLKPNTTYYIKGYAMNEKGQGSTEMITVKTLTRSPEAGDNLHPGITEQMQTDNR